MKTLLIALCLGLFSMTQALEAAENTYAYDEQKELVEIQYIRGFREPGEILVNLMCVEGLCFEDAFSFGKIHNGWQSKVTCTPLKDQIVTQGGKSLEHMEIHVIARNQSETGNVEFEVSASMRFTGQIKDDGTITRSSQRKTITSTVNCSNLSLSESPMYYCHNEIGSDVSIGFVHQ